MVLVKGGEFEMGEQGGEDNPAHRVYLDSFFIAKFEVTVDQWIRFTQHQKIAFWWNHYEFLSMVGRNVGFQLPGNWPMYWVRWYEAVWFCNWMSEQEGLQPAYDFDARAFKKYLYESVGDAPQVRWNRNANGYRLPTEAEWEYVAKIGSVGEQSNLERFAWHESNAKGSIHPVGTKLPNRLGVYDLFGNVGEWCWDFFDAGYYAISPQKNPIGPERGYDPVNFEEGDWDIRSNRGCGWESPQDVCTATFRFRTWAGYRGPIGIRLARNIDKQ